MGHDDTETVGEISVRMFVVQTLLLVQSGIVVDFGPLNVCKY